MMWARLKLYFAAIALFIAGLVALYAKGRADARMATAQRRLQDEVDAHDRITNADTGIGASDAERIKRLQHLGQQWERNQ